MVEQHPFKLLVGGSNPPGPTAKRLEVKFMKEIREGSQQPALPKPLSEQLADKWFIDMIESGNGEQIVREEIAKAGLTEDQFLKFFAAMGPKEIRDYIDLTIRRRYH